MSIFIQDESKVEMAPSQQHTVDNQLLVTLPFRNFSFSHRDASISRKSHLVIIKQLSIYHPLECWNKFLVTECPSGIRMSISSD